MMINWNEESIRWFHNASIYTGFHKKLSYLLNEHIAPGSTICDLGCGMGIADLYLAKSAKEITCVDISEIPLRYIDEEAARIGISNIETLLSDVNTLSGTWDTVISQFYGNAGKSMEMYLSLSAKNVIAVIHGTKNGNLGPVKYKLPKCVTILETLASLEKLEVKWKFSEHFLEYGQPFKDEAEAFEFVNIYSIDPPKRAVDDFLKERLIRTGDTRWPLYLPNKKHFGIFVVERA